jgi:ABC-type branched-subunit amino acid transport system ATPase component
MVACARPERPMLEIRHLSKAFGGVKAIDEVSMTFETGSLTAMIGPNGAGKSTFFNLISGAIRPDSGRVLLDGSDLVGLSRTEIVRRGIGRASRRPCSPASRHTRGARALFCGGSRSTRRANWPSA